VTIIDYDSDQSVEATPSEKNKTHPKHSTSPSTGTTTNNISTNTTTVPVFGTELVSLKQELTQLKEVIAMAVTQIKEAIAVLLEAKHTTTSSYMTNDANQIMDSAPAAENLIQLDLQSFITDLKHELATVFMETCTMIQQKSLVPMTTNHLPLKT